MRQISFIIILGSFLFVGCSQNTAAEKENTDTPKTETQPKEEIKEPEKKEDLSVQEIGDKSLIYGEWKMVEMGGKPVPEDRKEVTATFEKDGNFQRRLSPKNEPDKGTWSIDVESDKKILRLNTSTAREINQLLKLTKDELIFENHGKSVKLQKIK